MDEATLERLREQSGLRLDREGRLWHEGAPVEHARTLAVLLRNVHRAPNGRWATRIGNDWAYLEVEDTPLFIRRIDGARAQLGSGEWVPFDRGSLAVGEGDALYVRVDGERARLTREAQLALSDALTESGGRFLYEGSPIGHDPGPEPIRRR